jgi:hypothetical protein
MIEQQQESKTANQGQDQLKARKNSTNYYSHNLPIDPSINQFLNNKITKLLLPYLSSPSSFLSSSYHPQKHHITSSASNPIHHLPLFLSSSSSSKILSSQLSS